MAETHHFHSAINGFNRKDVSEFIEFLCNKHNAQVNQMRIEMEALRAERDAALQAPVRSAGLENELAAVNCRCAELEDQLAAANRRCAELEDQLAAANAQLEQAKSGALTAESRLSAELEAYRRAEQAERLANRRALSISTQASSILADATVQVDETATQISDMAQSIADKLEEFHSLMIAGKATLQEANTAMQSIRPADYEL